MRLNTFIATPDPDQGAEFFLFKVLPDELQEESDGIYAFKEEKALNLEAGERILGCRFYPWRTALTVRCLYTNSVMARLMEFLLERGIMTVSFRADQSGKMGRTRDE